tara:strand:+ start:274 stop:792 length:519 start_codon:yes stop_codon:yes gene_type:complete
MKNKILLTTLIIFFVILFLIFYKGLIRTNIYTPNIISNTSIPSFSAKILGTNDKINSENVFNSDQFYLLNIWSSWCVPCREEHYFLMKLKNKENIKIIGLNYKDKEANAKNFLKELKNPYDIILLDKDGTIAIEWGAYGVPETFLINKKKIIKKIVGPLEKNLFLEIENLIE